MASAYMMRPLCTSHTLYPTPYGDRICRCGSLRVRKELLRPSLVVSCPGDWSFRNDIILLTAKLSPSIPRIHGIARSDVAGHSNAVAETNVESQLSNPILEAQSVSGTNSTEANGVTEPADSSADPGPEFDFQVYAANTMVGYEPPPPPRIPFGGPFEDYYDEYVGVDYVPKQEKPTSSFLMFLESLNQKRAEEEAKLREKDPSRPPFNPTPNKHLFEGKPLFTIPRPIQPAPVPRDYVPPDPEVDSTPKRIFSPLPPKEERRKSKKPETDAAPAEGVESEVPVSVANVSSSTVGITDTEQRPFDNFSPADSGSQHPPYEDESKDRAGTENTTMISSVFISSSASGSTSIDDDEPSFDGRILAPQLRSSGHTEGLLSSTEPFSPVTKPFEAPADTTGSLSSQTVLTSSEPISSANKPTEENNLAILEEDSHAEVEKVMLREMPKGERESFEFQGTPTVEGAREKLFDFDIRDTKESRPAFPTGSTPPPLDRPLYAVSSSESNFVSQVESYGPRPSLAQGQFPTNPGNLASQSTPFGASMEARQMPTQADRIFWGSPEAMPLTSEFYEPKDGDIVLGIITHADEDELTLEVGAKFPALMTMRDFQPFAEVGPDDFFKIPSGSSESETAEDVFLPPEGKVFLVEDEAANDGVFRGENVCIGTILVAEVQSKALMEGRPVLSCRRLARSLGFIRIEQMMRAGEPIEIEINQWNDGGLQGYIEGIRAFLPRSELLRRPENSAALQDYVGKKLQVAILKAEEYSSNIIVSEVKAWMSENLLLGAVHDLLVTRLYPYGMQVEIIGTRIRGFVHISSISRGYVTSVYTFFVEGDETKGMVIKGRKPGQLSFSIQALEPLSQEGLFLRDRQTVYLGAEEVAKSTDEYKLPIEERRIFALPSAATSVTLQNSIANLPWLKLENLRNSV